MNCLIELHYLPSIAYFASLQDADEIILERHEHFIKQTYRNRCYINTSHGKEDLIIPLTSKYGYLPERQGKVLITDIRIDYHQKWVNNHWRTIQSAYGKAPFFEFYADDLQKALFYQHEFLYDLNFQLLTLCLKWLKWQKPIKESLSYEKVPKKELIDLRNRILAKKTGIQTFIGHFPSYTQVFGNAFVPDLSLLDVIFCMGPGAAALIRQTRIEQL